MIVTFDPIQFRAENPTITPEKVTDAELEAFFDYAQLIIDNTEDSPFPYDPPRDNTRKIMLYLLVCHQAMMALWEPGQSGPIGSASQGSVSVSFTQMAGSVNSWLGGTTCGQKLLFMVKKYTVGGHIHTPQEFHPYG